MKKKGKISYSKYGYIFCIPFMIAYLIFHFYPTLYTAIIGFTDLRGAGKISFNFLKGAQFFENYKIILTNATFHIALKNTVRIYSCYLGALKVVQFARLKHLLITEQI